ncbi:hypothetical protein BS50DRAFT_569907 [Corynespora cassiicola Philippines]|uniref:Uncharacterized protein n=1 Tax=Corynespora cassiicola Philippines TaxID=1448308 RepID=A0A2T2P408_CORCC|nr:hypothetical protein BS50DRAFT_569907 [Corynespora cassiicola Philippines]
MTIPKDEHYYIETGLSKREWEMIDALRKSEHERRCRVRHHQDRLSKQIDFSASVDGIILGTVAADGYDTMEKLGKWGADISESLVDDIFWHAKIQAQQNDDLIFESLFEGSQTVGQAQEPLAWESARKDVIPAYVQRVDFKVLEDDKTFEIEQELESRFPDVAIQYVSQEELDGKPKSIEEPRAVQKATFEVDADELKRDPSLEEKLRGRFPWADLRPATPLKLVVPAQTQETAEYCPPSQKLTLNVMVQSQETVTRVPPKARLDLVVLASSQEVKTRKTKPMQYMIDILCYAWEPYKERETGYEYVTSKSWGELDTARRLEIAHARAIQGRYGMESEKPCTGCVKRDLKCKVYRSSWFKNVPVPQITNTCQNCRLFEDDCSHLIIEEVSMVNSKMCSMVDQATQTTETQLVSTLDESGTYVEKKADMDCSSTSRMAKAEPSWRGFKDEQRPPVRVHHDDWDKIALKHGLKLGKSQVIDGLMKHFYNVGQVRAYLPYYYLPHYFENLVDLYILSLFLCNDALSYATLIRFQITTFEQMHVPDLKTVLRLYHFCPQSPLTRWVTILFSYLWRADYGLDFDTCYKQLHLRESQADDSALARFLYEVMCERHARMRGLTPSEGKSRWCEVHSHVRGSYEERDCLNGFEQPGISTRVKNLEQEKDLVEIRAFIERRGGRVDFGDPGVGANETRLGRREEEEGGMQSSTWAPPPRGWSPGSTDGTSEYGRRRESPKSGYDRRRQSPTRAPPRTWSLDSTGGKGRYEARRQSPTRASSPSSSTGSKRKYEGVPIGPSKKFATGEWSHRHN